MHSKSVLSAPDLADRISAHRAAIIAGWYANQFSADIFAKFPNAFAQKASETDVKNRHLRPLVDLLIEFNRTGDSVYRELYLAERRRYSPHREGNERLTSFFRTVLPIDEEVVGNLLGTTARAWLHDIHEPLVTPSQNKPITVLTIGDCLLGQIQSFLISLGLKNGIALDFRYFYFSALLGVTMRDEGIVQSIHDGVDLIAISYLSYEGIPLYRSLLETADSGHDDKTDELISGITSFIRNHLQQLRELTDAPILLHNACGLPLTPWRSRIPMLPAMSYRRRLALAKVNKAITGIAEHLDNCILIDETTVVERHGIRQCGRNVLPRWIGRNADMHPTNFARYLADSYYAVIRDWAMLRRTKLLLVDFDNTLWAGVMADGPVIHHSHRQRLLKKLSEAGILLAAVSKNDAANVRWEEMALSQDDFVSIKINWNLKAQSILEIASELNLGCDSFVLLDDNPAERELVRQEIPDVVAMDSLLPETWGALERLFSMPNTRQTEEARRRTQMYKEQVRRDEAMSLTSDYPTLMAALALCASIGKVRAGDLDRLTELVQRTNQFNTTTIRYTRGELEAMIRSERHDILVGELADKFGGLGIVCAVVVRKDDCEVVIDSFVMSCRAMGFGMEQLMLHYVVKAYTGCHFVGKFVPSMRNEPASTLYRSAGFVERCPGEWLLSLDSSVPAPPWIALDERR